MSTLDRISEMLALSSLDRIGASPEPQRRRRHLAPQRPVQQQRWLIDLERERSMSPLLFIDWRGPEFERAIRPAVDGAASTVPST